MKGLVTYDIMNELLSSFLFFFSFARADMHEWRTQTDTRGHGMTSMVKLKWLDIENFPRPCVNLIQSNYKLAQVSFSLQFGFCTDNNGTLIVVTSSQQFLDHWAGRQAVLMRAYVRWWKTRAASATDLTYKELF